MTQQGQPTNPLGDLSPTKAAALAELTPAPVRSGDLLMAHEAITAAYSGDILRGRTLLACITPDAHVDMAHTLDWAAATLRSLTPEHAAVAAAALTPDAEVRS